MLSVDDWNTNDFRDINRANWDERAPAHATSPVMADVTTAQRGPSPKRRAPQSEGGLPADGERAGGAADG